jgi:hypothetical protein
LVELRAEFGIGGLEPFLQVVDPAHRGGDAVEINDIRIEASEPTFQCRTSETTAVRRGDTVTIAATEYTVERYQRVGIGVTVFYLKV